MLSCLTLSPSSSLHRSRAPTRPCFKETLSFWYQAGCEFVRQVLSSYFSAFCFLRPNRWMNCIEIHWMSEMCWMVSFILKAPDLLRSTRDWNACPRWELSSTMVFSSDDYTIISHIKIMNNHTEGWVCISGLFYTNSHLRSDTAFRFFSLGCFRESCPLAWCWG